MTNLAFVENYAEVRKRLRGVAPKQIEIKQNILKTRMARVLYAEPLRPGAGFEHASARVRAGVCLYDEPCGPPYLTDSLARAKFIRAGLSRFSGFSIEEVIGRQRNGELVEIRHYAIYLISKCTRWSLPQIGRFFGGRDHTGVIHAIERIKKQFGEIEETSRGIRYAKQRALGNVGDAP